MTPSFSYFSYLLLQLPVVQFIVGLINISIALSYDSESGQTVTTLGSYKSIASALLGGEPFTLACSVHQACAIYNGENKSSGPY